MTSDETFVKNQKEKFSATKKHLYSFVPAERSLTGVDKLIKYDNKGVASMRAVWHLKHTVFLEWTVILQVLFYLLLTTLITYISWYFGVSDEHSGENVAKIVGNLTIIAGFMLGSYVSTSASRWWSMRCEGIGGVWQTVDDICLILSSHMPDPADRVYKQRFLRLGLLSCALCYCQARGEDSEDTLKDLVTRGLITEEELNIIKSKPSKPQVVWVWLSQLVHNLAQAGKIQYPDMMVPQLDKMCAKGRGAIGTLFAYTDTQIPYIWVHMLSVTVVMICCVISLKCGLTLAFIFQDPNNMGISWPRIFAEVCHVTFLPFAFSAFMLLGGQLANPLGDDFIDFPGLAYHCSMRDENSCFFEAGEKTPPTVLEGL